MMHAEMQESYHSVLPVRWERPTSLTRVAPGSESERTQYGTIQVLVSDPEPRGAVLRNGGR